MRNRLSASAKYVCGYSSHTHLESATPALLFHNLFKRRLTPSIIRPFIAMSNLESSINHNVIIDKADDQ